MAYAATQNDINLLRQGSQEVYLKVELLNKNFKVLDSLEGVIINDNFSVNSDSAQRRSYTCDILLTDSSFTIGKDRKIWFDKRLRVYYGMKSLRTQEISWYRIGTFVYVSMDYRYSQTERTLSLTCADLMAEYDGTLNGQIGNGTARGLTIPAGEDIRETILALLSEAHISHYLVNDICQEIPYDLEFQTGVTYYDVWKKICGLYETWEFFFDENGTFIWREIPNCAATPVTIDDSLLSHTVIDESAATSFDGIYNVTEVWGKILELEHNDSYSDTSTYTDNTYHVTIDGYTSWDDVDNLTKFAVKIPAANSAAPYFSLNNYPPIPILDGDGTPLKAEILNSNTVYVFRYRRTIPSSADEITDRTPNPARLYLLGQYQCYGKYVENSDECPFSVKNLGYEITQSVDYEGLSSDASCYNQAEYLTYASTAMMDTVTLTSLVIPWLDVNTKVRYTTKYNNTTSQYIIKNFQWSTGAGTMSMTLYKFLESFSFVYDRRHKTNER